MTRNEFIAETASRSSAECFGYKYLSGNLWEFIQQSILLAEELERKNVAPWEDAVASDRDTIRRELAEELAEKFIGEWAIEIWSDPVENGRIARKLILKHVGREAE